MSKSITAHASHSPIDLCHAAAILSQEIKKALYLPGDLVLTARLTVQKKKAFLISWDKMGRVTKVFSRFMDVV